MATSHVLYSTLCGLSAASGASRSLDAGKLWWLQEKERLEAAEKEKEARSYP